jgi:hypothetical protein
MKTRNREIPIERPRPSGLEGGDPLGRKSKSSFKKKVEDA